MPIAVEVGQVSEQSPVIASSGFFLRPHAAVFSLILFLLFLSVALSLHAEDGSAGWLRYAPSPDMVRYHDLPRSIRTLSNDPVSENAARELALGLNSEIHKHAVITNRMSAAGEILLGTSVELAKDYPSAVKDSLEPEGFRLRMVQRNGKHDLLIEGGSSTGELYGVFRLLERIALGESIEGTDTPESSIRWTDEWDNLDGSIERGYAGRSIFFSHGRVREDLSRARMYARLLASVGINGCNVNNVNADLDLLTTEHLKEFARLAEAFRPWGIKLALSVDLSSPISVGGMQTFDPKDPAVADWWSRKVDEIYALLPNFGGFTVKADSEGRPGPSQYGRSPVDAANMLARALKPHGGLVLYRGFVYNHHLDWHDLKADRARAGYDNFAKYDGQFESNVIIQIKHGPIDFQAREPISPLFGALSHTSQVMELQVAQEYTGQQRHMVYLPSMWKWVLDTDMRAEGKPSTVASIVTGKRFAQPYGGFVAVVNAGMEANWLHHPMAMANLYGLAKLAWHPGADLDQILDRWTRLTWGNDPIVAKTIDTMLASSWRTYEDYTGPNGMGTLTDILGPHFGPGIESAERNGWGMWFRGEKNGIGMDRTIATGTGYIGQYPPEFAVQYETLARCPDDLLLFFHHVPYDYQLHSGKSLIQSVYDTHYAGALAAAQYVAQWETLRGKVDAERYEHVHALLTYQAGHAIVWRDAINTWFHQMSGIADSQGRVEQDKNRVEAEEMMADGYVSVTITPAETASNGKAMICRQASGCTLQMKIPWPSGTYNLAVQYFDLRTGISQYALLLNGKQIAAWKADDTLPPAVVRGQMDGQTSTRYTVHSVTLHPDDVLILRGIPDLEMKPAHDEGSASRVPAQNKSSQAGEEMRELAPVDYIEVGPDGPVTPQ